MIILKDIYMNLSMDRIKYYFKLTYNPDMKKLILPLLAFFFLIGVPKDRNFDGKVSITDIWLSIGDNILIPVGISIQSLFSSFIGKFLEVDIRNLDRSNLLGLGFFGTFFISVILFFIWSFIIKD
mgnify:CR=1 FL=1